jgi:hypothetical protein
MAATISLSAGTRAEISGWDHDENFFVEKISAVFFEGDVRSISLRRSIRVGALLFFRTLPAVGGVESLPRAYRATSVTGPNADGCYRVEIEPMRAHQSH